MSFRKPRTSLNFVLYFFRGKYQRVKAIEEATGCAADTNIQPPDTSNEGYVIYKSGKSKVAKPEKGILNSLQHQTKLTEQVAKVGYILFGHQLLSVL